MGCTPSVQRPVSPKPRQSETEPTKMSTIRELEYSLPNKKLEYSFPKPEIMIPDQQWYVEDTRRNNGQWYLSLRDTGSEKQWVWQPEQNGNNMLTVLYLEPSHKIKGFPFAQVQQAYFNPTKDSGLGICMAATNDQKLVVSNLTIENSPEFFKGPKQIYIPVDPRFFKLTKESSLPADVYLNSESLVVESAMYPGCYLGINWNDIQEEGANSYSPAVLFPLGALSDTENKFDFVRLPPDHIAVKRLIIDA